MKYFFGIFAFCLLIHVADVCAQAYVLKNEVSVFSFTTKNGKQMVLAKEKQNGYFVYRFGTSKKVEFEYPVKTANSWKQFTYSFWMRGGGTQNEGMDVNYVYFKKDQFQYVVYDTYYATGNKFSVGIKVIDTVTKKETNIEGIYKTKKGNLTVFRDNGLLTIGDELF